METVATLIEESRRQNATPAGADTVLDMDERLLVIPFEEASKEFKKLVPGQDDYWIGLLWLSQAGRGGFNEGRNAFVHFQKALQSGFNVVRCTYFLGRALASFGNTTDALQCWSRLSQSVPECKKARELLAYWTPTDAKENEMYLAVQDIPGWMQEQELRSLYRFAKTVPSEGRILEMGSYRGRSTNAIGHAIQGKNIRLFCLDAWHHMNTLGIFEHDASLAGQTMKDEDVLAEFISRTHWMGDTRMILQGSTAIFSDFLPGKYFDMVFVDASHEYQDVKCDVQIALRTLKPGGLLCGHDYQPHIPGVVKAVDECVFSRDDGTDRGICEGASIWYYKNPL